MSYRLLSYAAEPKPRAGILVGDAVYDVARTLEDESLGSVLDILDGWDRTHKRMDEVAKGITGGKLRASGTPLQQIQLLAPVLFPGEVFAAGANYVDHVEEMNRKLPGPRVPR